jgi:stage III sporulation protein AE
MKRSKDRLFRKRFIKLILCLLIIYLTMLCTSKKAKAIGKGDFEDIDCTQIQEVINDILKNDDAYDFKKYTEKLVNGEEPFSIAQMGEQFVKSIRAECMANVSMFIKLVSIALIAAVFTNLSMAFKNRQVSETGYYVTYLLLFGLLIGSFITASKIAADTIGSILEFMRALLPVYFMSVGFCNGSTTAFVYYEAALGLILLVDTILIKIVIPMINCYLIITLVNYISREDMLSKLGGLFAMLIDWLLKSLVAAVVGFSVIQGLVVPVADRVKRSALLKASEAIPGIGNTLGSVTETVLGAGMLLKNAIGAAGLIAVVVICAIPMMKLLIVLLVYKISGATLQPVSDKRMVECIGASAKSTGLLLQTVFVGGVLFLIAITIVAVTTGNAA